MADNESIVTIRLAADTSGAEKAEKAVEEVEKAAKKTGDGAEKAAEKAEKAVEKAALNTRRAATNAADVTSGAAKRAAGAWNVFTGTVQKCKSAIGAITGALGVVGFAIQGVQLIISAFQALKGWLEKDKREAEELARQIQDEKNKAAIDAAAASYEKLNAKLAETLNMEKERDRLADQRLAQDRAKEDAEAELAMQKEIADIAVDDPDRAEKVALVRSKYARVRADRAADRARHDVATRRSRLEGEAGRKDSAADEMEKDIYGESGDAVISVRRQMMREKDPERLKSLDATLDRLIEQQQKKLAEVRRLRGEADALRREAANILGADTAASVTAQAVHVAQDAADAETRARISTNLQGREAARREKEAKATAKAAQIAADRETVANGRSELEGLQLNEAAARAQAQAAAAAYAKEQGDVVEAQNRYDMLAVNGGPRRERSAALAALQKEQEEANEAKFEMERVAAQLANTLQGLTAQIKAVSNAVQKAESRLAQNQADAPEG